MLTVYELATAGRGRDHEYRAQVQVLWLGRDQFNACTYDLAENESILENFSIVQGDSVGGVHHPYVYESNVVLSVCTTKSQGIDEQMKVHPR